MNLAGAWVHAARNTTTHPPTLVTIGEKLLHSPVPPFATPLSFALSQVIPHSFRPQSNFFFKFALSFLFHRSSSLQVSFDELTPTSITSTKVLSGGSFEVEFSGGPRLMGARRAGGNAATPSLDTGDTRDNPNKPNLTRIPDIWRRGELR